MAHSYAYDRKYALNAICPYFTMFPLEYPLRVLKRYQARRAVVLDPFCGRGTTLFAARMLGLDAWGIDSSPVAVAIARAKLAHSSTQAVLALAKELLESVTPSDVPHNEFFELAFHPTVLHDLCALREGLLGRSHESNASVLLRAAVLGCLHGPRSKSNENHSYLSNQMPRTFSPKPDYAVRFWKEHGMRPRTVSVLDVLKRKLARIAFKDGAAGRGFLRVLLGDSTTPSLFPRQGCNFSVVVTSPPYFGMKTYVQDQWLRNWFLGGPAQVSYAMTEQLSHDGKLRFASALGTVWDNLGASKVAELHMHIRFGALPSSKVEPRKLFLSSIEASRFNWKLVSTRSADSANDGKRQAAQMLANSAPMPEYDFHLCRS